MPEKKTKLKAPYGSYPSVKSFIGELAKTVYPPHVDRDMMKGMSGQTQSEVMTALRFLGGIDAKNNTRAPLKKLVENFGTDSWQKVLRGAAESVYMPIVGPVDIAAGSAKQLQGAFNAYTGADGFMLTRYIRFYLSILKDAGVEYSPHFKVPKAQKIAPNGAKKKTAKKSTKRGEKPSEETESETPDRMFDLNVPFGAVDGLIRVPRDIQTSQLPVFKSFVEVVERLAEQNSEGQSK